MKMTREDLAAVKDMMYETTPPEITEEIFRFCRNISSATPVFVNLHTADDMIQSECFDNVEKYIGLNGGRSVLGWSLWQSKIFLHAECHCNWASPDGQLVDITPKGHGEQRILFLPDDTIVDEKRTIPSRREGRFPSDALDALVSNHEKREALFLAHPNGLSNLHPDGRRLQQYEITMGYLEHEVLGDYKRWCNATPA